MNAPMLEMQGFPERFLTLAPRQVRRAFPAPTLIELPGRAGRPVFLSVLLHGNETTGFLVLQRLARWIRTHPLPRPMLIFVGNVEAAEAGRRHLDHQCDFNRIWNGGDTSDHALARAVLDRVAAAHPFAAIDIHNNTGTNPLYACINELKPAWLHLASLFSPTLVYFRNPPSVISIALSRLCPAVTVEAGKPGEPAGVEAAFSLVCDVLHLAAFRTAGLERPLHVYQTLGRVLVEPGTSFAFSSSSNADLVLAPEMDHWNFVGREAGSHWACVRRAGAMPLRVLDENNRDLTSQYFKTTGHDLILTQPATPSMISLDPEIVRGDCLGYLMTTITPDSAL